MYVNQQKIIGVRFGKDLAPGWGALKRAAAGDQAVGTVGAAAVVLLDQRKAVSNGFEARSQDRDRCRGQHWFDDAQLYMREIEVFGIPACGDEPAIYEARLLANGNLSLTKIEDNCEPRVDSTQREHAPATAAGEPGEVSAATTAAAAASPEGEPSAPSSELTLATLAGVWLQEHAGIYLELNADGTYKAWNGPPKPGGFPKEAGGLELNGTQLTLQSSDDGLMCQNQSGTYEVIAWSSDDFELALVADECEPRKGNLSAP